MSDPYVNDPRRGFHAGTWDERLRAYVLLGEIRETDADIESRGPKPRVVGFEHVHLDGYVQVGPYTYERLPAREDDFKQVWREGLAAVSSLRKRGEW